MKAESSCRLFGAAIFFLEGCVCDDFIALIRRHSCDAAYVSADGAGCGARIPAPAISPKHDEPADGARCGHHARRVVLFAPCARADVRAVPPAKPAPDVQLLVLLADALLSRRMRRTPLSDVRRRTVLLIGSITLHNIPEGLAVGCAFGALASPGGAAWRSAWMLAIGIALQNFPEGAAVSLPRRLFLPPFVLLRTAIRRSRAACGDSGRTAGDSRPRRPAAAAFALRRRHGDGHLGGASAGMPKMPAAASDGSRDAGGLCPHDGTGYDGVMATLGRCPKPCQRRCLWTLRRVFDPLDTHSRLPCSSHLPAVGLLLLLLLPLHILFQAFPRLPHLH